jgi:hypothetical protein
MPARIPQPGSTLAGRTLPVEGPSTVEAPPSPLDSLELELPQCDANKVTVAKSGKKPMRERTLMEILEGRAPSAVVLRLTQPRCEERASHFTGTSPDEALRGLSCRSRGTRLWLFGERGTFAPI